MIIECARTIRVRYKCTQDAEDLYYGVDTHRVYARIPSNCDLVFWATTSKWSGGYEADCPIRAGVTMEVVDATGEVLFKETLEKDEWNGGTSARKIGEFKREAVDRCCKGVSEIKNLVPYDEWKHWLLADKEDFGYKGYNDNWLYCNSVDLNSKRIGVAEILGKRYKVMQTKVRHEICGKEWFCYDIWDDDMEVCEGICGYILL